MKSNYEEKKEARIEKYHELAEKNEKESTARFETARQIGSFIPMGQPILVGHHSEGRHRRDLAKIDNNMRKSVEAADKAKYYERRAEYAEENTAVSSDDPDALAKLKAKLFNLESNQDFMKRVNAAIRKAKTEESRIVALREMGIKESLIVELLTPYYGSIGIPQFKLTNNTANIRTVKQRIERLEKIEGQPDEEKTIGNVRVVFAASENRVQMFFPGKPSDAVRTSLKSYGFRWAPTVGAWMAFYSNRAKFAAEQIAASI